MAEYAILRIEKLKTRGSVASQASHVERTRPTKNADPSRTHLNRWLVGGPGMYESAKKTWDSIPKMRSDAVLAMDIMITASPEAFLRPDFDLEKWTADSVAWLKTHLKGAEIVGLQLQLDESTPHLQGIAVPTDLKADGTLQLNAKKWLGGKAKLRAMQTSYAKAVESHGLLRGIEGSDAKHERIKSFYGAINAPSPVKFGPIQIAPPPMMLTQKARESWAEQQRQQVIEAMRQPIADLRNQVRAGVMNERQVEHLKRSNSRLNADLEDARRREKESAAQLRSLPLEQVAQALGCFQSKKLLEKDQKMWESPAGKIRIDGTKFFNHEEGVGGGGAFDLVMHVNDCNYAQALAFLRDEFDPSAAIQAAADAARIKAMAEVEKAAPAPFQPPQNVEERWPRVRHYLTEVRALAGSLVDKLKAQGWIGADFRNNAFFLKVVGNRQVAAELRGTGQSHFKGSRGRSSEGVFPVLGGKAKLAVCESAIDAISYVQLHPGSSAIATGGTGKWKAALPFLEQHAQEYGEIVCASDNGEGGTGMAKALGLPHEPPPRGFDDWNEFAQAASITPSLLEGLEAKPEPEPKAKSKAQPRKSRDEDVTLG